MEKQYILSIGFSWKDWANNALGVVDFCMSTGINLLKIAHIWLWVIRQIIDNGCAEERDRIKNKEAKEEKNKNSQVVEEIAEARQEILESMEKIEADWQRRSALVKLNMFRVVRSTRIGHQEGINCTTSNNTTAI